MHSLVTFLILFTSFSSCFSLKEEGVDFLKTEDSLKKDLRSDEDSNNLKAIGYHRKTLVHNPYNDLPSRKKRLAAATITPSPSPKHVSTNSSTVQEPQKKQSRQDLSAPPPFSTPLANPPTPRRSSSSSVPVTLVVGCISGIFFLLLLATGVYFFTSKVGKTVNPWRTGLSGQLQRVFVTGVPVLKRSEIEAACEDFSNVIGSCEHGKLFKGTLSSGVEIAVASFDTTSAKNWKDITEIHFRKKIEMLSKINHKNFVNLLGYCEEKEPFTRILIFEYAPNGSLSEHLHCKESEHLDWAMRLRITMGVAYCLDHMHNLNPPIPHTNLISSFLQLAEDYAVKVSDFTFNPSQTESTINNTTIADNVYSFGLLLFEIITGKLNKPDSVDTGLVHFLRGSETLVKMVDPTLEESYDDEMIENIGEVIKSCLRSDPKERPIMREVTGWLREITGVSPIDARPKLSPLWWAELEVVSSTD